MKNARKGISIVRLLLALLIATGGLFGSGLAGRASAATDRHIGPGQAYETIGAFPWETLGPGDRVYIHWREEPYNEKILLSGQGTASEPIQIIGVPGPYVYMRPVISGDNSSYSGNMHYADAGSSSALGDAGLGVIVVKKPAGAPSGYKPQHIVIDGLKVSGGKIGNTVQDPDGNILPNPLSTAGIYIEGADNVTVRNCVIENNSQGVWAVSGGTEDEVTRDLIIEGNEFNLNGYEGGPLRGNDQDHSIYAEVAGITVQHNYFFPLADGSRGSQFKDRSSGTLFRYNVVEGFANAPLLELVEPIDGASILTGEPGFGTAHVYGNAFHNMQISLENPGLLSDKLIRWGGESVNPSAMRNGTLYFYHNSTLVQANQSEVWHVSLFDMPDNNQTVDVRNNIFYSVSFWGQTSPELYLLRNGIGNAELGVNLISPGWSISGSEVPTGVVTGTEQLFSPTNNDIGYLDPFVSYFRLRAGSLAINAGGPLSPSLTPELLPTSEYAYRESFDFYGQPHSTIPRIEFGPLDLGAFEFGSTGPADITPPDAPVGLTATSVSTTQIDLEWDAVSDDPGGSGIYSYNINRNGLLYSTTRTTSFSDYASINYFPYDIGVKPGKVYTFTVQAVDKAGNISAESEPVIVSTPALYAAPGYLYDEQQSDFLFDTDLPTGGSSANVGDGLGDGGGNAIRYDDLDNWDRTVPVLYDLPADMSVVTPSQLVMRLKLSQETAGGSPMRIVFNGVSWEGAPSLNFTPAETTDYQTVTIPLPEGFMEQLDNSVASFYFERLAAAWPAGTTVMLADEIRFE
ncbi:right-handed parallel beta-helix repeat-containing protein [Cohnella panacarvi]|uniref:right-handed parallel beta-helix repeat-containing protein n=1 Tax=Cohnella panacarvi TaxID=400776 RepID=UPI00047A619D|nr:right-handed parallel beta-helix repeat-containing protein [Cohnella panacarvi]